MILGKQKYKKTEVSVVESTLASPIVSGGDVASFLALTLSLPFDTPPLLSQYDKGQVNCTE